jgi:hypothetical protein
MKPTPSIELVLGLASVAFIACAGPVARAADLPEWPHEQQAMLRDVEGRLLRVQHQMFAARQQDDRAAVVELGKQFSELQAQRRQLIELTKDQLPSE